VRYTYLGFGCIIQQSGTQTWVLGCSILQSGTLT
jgi:hypothetical protein